MLDAKTLKKIERVVDNYCGKDEGGGRDAGRILLASAIVGAFPEKVANAFGWEVSRVIPYAKRLRKSGIWRNGKVYADWDGEDGGIGFCCDVNVALGFMERA